jgi:hypothetical protein
VTRQFSPKSFLRRAPSTLLKRYLGDKRVAVDVPQDRLRARDVDRLFAAIEAAPEEIRRQIDRDFREIDEMTDQGGVKTIIEEAQTPHHGVDLAETLGGMASSLESAFWVFLEYPRVFSVAQQFHHADSLSRWRKRDRLPECEPSIDEESKQRLAAAISGYYRLVEGRGAAYHVDHYERGERLYWFAYLEDYAEGRLVFTDQHELVSQTLRPAFEVIFVYSKDERSLDMHVRGDKRTLLELQKIFGRAILGVELDDPRETDFVYELSPLLDRNFPLPVEPEDGVQGARVRRLRLNVMGQGNRRITLQADVRNNPKAVYDLLDDILAGNRIPRELLNVTQAGLQLVFRSDSDRRTQTLSFDVSFPNSCSLKYDPKHEIAKRYLKRWGLDVSGRAESDLAKRRRPAQFCIRA